jgi:hypothetical protein
MEVLLSNNGSMETAFTIKREGIQPAGSIIDSTNSIGTSNQLLSANGTGLQWISKTTTELLRSSGTFSAITDESVISSIGTYVLPDGVYPNQQKTITILPCVSTSSRAYWSSAFAGNFSTGGTITCGAYDSVNRRLYFGGSFFQTPDGVQRSRIAMYSEVTGLFYSLGTGISNGNVISMLWDAPNNRLYVGGSFTTAGGVTGATRIAMFNVSGLGTGSWSALDAGKFPTGGQVNAMVLRGDILYVGGTFTSITSTANTNLIATFGTVGSAWGALGTGCSATAVPSGLALGVNALFVDGANVYVGGNFSEAGGVANTQSVCYWNTSTSTFVPMGQGLTIDSVTCFQKYESSIVVGGTFMSVKQTGGTVLETGRVALWNISTGVWSAMGSGFNSQPNAFLIRSNGDLIAVGSMTANSLGLDAYQRIVRWNTTKSKWDAFGGVSGTVEDIFQTTSGELIPIGTFNASFGNANTYGYGINPNALVLIPNNFSYVTGSNTIYDYQIAGKPFTESITFIWNTTTNKWINTRTAGYLTISQ